MWSTVMKIWGISLVLNVALIAASTEEKDCVCPAVYAPVCASNDITYSSACRFRCKNGNRDVKIVYDGTCEAYHCFKRCHRSPSSGAVCGTDGVTYDNKCYLECSKVDHPEKADVKVAYPGQCKKDCFCYLSVEKVCGSNGKTYSNKCFLSCDDSSLKVVHNGSCEAYNCFRHCEHTPLNICATDGKTYGSKCALDCEKIDNPEKEDVEVAHNGRCKQKCACKRMYAPVCGSDRNTYNNECIFNCIHNGYRKTPIPFMQANAFIAYSGRC